MTYAQIAIIAVLLATMGMFLWGCWRHDMVALGALLACVFAGLVPGREAFSGFGHPAVITVACVLVLGYGLQISGAVEGLTRIWHAWTVGVSGFERLAGFAPFLIGFAGPVLVLLVYLELRKRTLKP